MSDNPQARRRADLWDSFMPKADKEPASALESSRAEAGQTLVLHTPHTLAGTCEYCGKSWVCGSALWAAFILELLG